MYDSEQHVSPDIGLNIFISCREFEGRALDKLVEMTYEKYMVIVTVIYASSLHEYMTYKHPGKILGGYLLA